MVRESEGLPAEAKEVLEFWFRTLKPEQWWKRDDVLDAEITERFGDLYERLAREVPEEWLASSRGRLAAVIVLDQFPRNMFRGDPRCYAADGKALALAAQTVAAGGDANLETQERAFLYMPFQHSEDAAAQKRSVELFADLGDENNLDFAIKHKDIIDRFGRFPHRNEILGRKSTPEEVEFLKGPALFW